MPLDQPDFAKMSLGDHIEELRTCLVHSLIGLAVALVLTFSFGFQIIAWLTRPVAESLVAYGYPPQLYARDATAGFASVYIPVTLIAAAIIASPWIIYQLWKFISAGLYREEKKVIYILAPFSTVMTVLAVVFTYYILLPVCLMFFIRWTTYYPAIGDVEPNWLISRFMLEHGEDIPPVQYDEAPLNLPVLEHDPQTIQPGDVWINAQEEQIKVGVKGQVRVVALTPDRLLTPWPDLGSLVKFAAMMGLGVVIAFQTPVVMLVLGWTGVVDPRWIAQFRKYALFAIVIVSAVLTPVDVFSMFVLAIPLYALFEFGLWVMRWVYRPPAFPDET